MSKAEVELAAESAVAMLSWLLLVALSDACSIIAVFTTDMPLSCMFEPAE